MEVPGRVSCSRRVFLQRLKECRNRQQVYQESGRHIDAFLQLQQLRQVAPRYPGLSQLLTEAAQAAAGSSKCGRCHELQRV